MRCLRGTTPSSCELPGSATTCGMSPSRKATKLPRKSTALFRPGYANPTSRWRLLPGSSREPRSYGAKQNFTDGTSPAFCGIAGMEVPVDGRGKEVPEFMDCVELNEGLL